MFRRILFPTDFSPGAAAAEAHVSGLAKAFGASVVVLHAVEPIPAPDQEHAFDDFYQRLLARARFEIEQVAERLRAQGVEVSGNAVVERRWAAIIDAAQRLPADLVVMGARGLDTDGRPALGTTSHKVFLMSKTPVLFVRAP